MKFPSPNAFFSSCHDYLIFDFLTKFPAQCVFKPKDINSSTIQVSDCGIFKTYWKNMSRGILHLKEKNPMVSDARCNHLTFYV